MTLNMKKSKSAGMSLIEIVVCVALLSLVAAPVLGLYFQCTQANVRARNINMATFTAQLQMEELVGLTNADIYSVIYGKLDGDAYPAGSVIKKKVEPKHLPSGDIVDVTYYKTLEPLEINGFIVWLEWSNAVVTEDSYGVVTGVYQKLSEVTVMVSDAEGVGYSSLTNYLYTGGI